MRGSREPSDQNLERAKKKSRKKNQSGGRAVFMDVEKAARRVVRRLAELGGR
jgi:hypothetical protein